MHRRFIGFLALKQKFIILLLLVFAIVLPFTIKNQYIFRLAILSLQWIFLTQSLNLLAGVLGQISLGHIAFYGIGAYTCTILAKNYDFPTWAAWLAAIAVAALFGFALALPTLRLSGHRNAGLRRNYPLDRNQLGVADPRAAWHTQYSETRVFRLSDQEQYSILFPYAHYSGFKHSAALPVSEFQNRPRDCCDQRRLHCC